jgi:hypothetical protein
MQPYSFNGLAGCVVQRRSQRTGTLVGLYAAEQADLDPDAGPWATVCERHNAITNHTTLSLARAHLPIVEWCEACQEQLLVDQRLKQP